MKKSWKVVTYEEGDTINLWDDLGGSLGGLERMARDCAANPTLVLCWRIDDMNLKFAGVYRDGRIVSEPVDDKVEEHAGLLVGYYGNIRWNPWS